MEEHEIAKMEIFAASDLIAQRRLLGCCARKFDIECLAEHFADECGAVDTGTVGATKMVTGTDPVDDLLHNIGASRGDCRVRRLDKRKIVLAIFGAFRVFSTPVSGAIMRSKE